jgi:hypothetical protein
LKRKLVLKILNHTNSSLYEFDKKLCGINDCPWRANVGELRIPPQIKTVNEFFMNSFGIYVNVKI